MGKIALFGDYMDDIYIHGTVNRLNPEGPVPLVNQNTVIHKPGGAGNVEANLLSLGLDVKFFKANTASSRKTRIVADNVTICRVDEDFISDPVDMDIDLSDYDYVLISDYNKGAITDCSNLIKNFHGKVFVDPKQNFINYKGAYCIKPNRNEFETHYGPATAENITRFAKENNHELVILTLGKDGLMFYYNNEVKILPSLAQDVADVIGAGDCFLSAMLYGFVNGYSVEDSIILGNRGAAECVKHMGTYILKVSDIIKTIVFTNGCFDILHAGHIDLLEKSKKLGEYLIVGLNSDSSVKRLKGQSRPINKQEDRKKALESIKFVDEVVIFEEDTPIELIKKVKPDIITKGGDYTFDSVVGNDLAIIKIIPLLEDHSTTNIIKKL
jgi:D-beta-D-heptose 7-phosphate kinase/D-beta-D-heptose 1-phosphate adenosyltransferase